MIWKDLDKMETINLVNKRTINTRIRNSIKLGLAGLMVWGVSWFTLRAYNQVTLSSNRQEIYKLVEQKKYDEASNLFEGLSGRRFLFSGTPQSEKDGFFEKIRQTKSQDLDTLIKKDDYSAALKLLEEIKGKEYFSAEDISKLESMVEDISPKHKIEMGDKALGSIQVERYESAQRELDKLGKSEPTLDRKLAKAYLVDISISYQDSKITPTHMNTKIGDLASFLEKHKSSAKLEPADLDKFFEDSKAYLGINLLGRIEIGEASQFIDRFNSFLTSVGDSSKDQRIKTLAQVIISYADNTIQQKSEVTNADLSKVDGAMNVCRTYCPENLEKFVGMYLSGFEKVKKDPILQKNFLDSGVMQAELLPVERQREIKTRIADGYVSLARTISDTSRKDAYLMLQTARGLYFNAGLKQEDKKITELESFIHSNFGNKGETAPKN